MNSLVLFSCLATIVGADVDWVRKEAEVRVYDSAQSLWVLEAQAPVDHPVTLTIALRIEEDRRAMLEQSFWEVSNPKHEKYGKHLSMEEITSLLAVPQNRVSEVAKYFKASGAWSVEVNPNQDMITVMMPASAAEKALKTELGFFVHSERADIRIVRAKTHYHLPAEIAEHVAMVGELLQFPRLRSQDLLNLEGSGSWPTGCSASGCNGLVTPAVLAERYKIPSPSDNSGASSMAVAEFQGQYFKTSDLSTFSSSCKRDVTVDKIIGGNSQSAGVEAELDIEYIKSVAPKVPLTVIYSSQYSLLNWVNQITSLSDPPLVHSVSYGNDEVQQASREYMLTCNTAFMKAGAKGLSILFASGDQGVCGRSGCGLFTHSRFHPDFPAASPYITAVGGTDFAEAGTIGDETAWSASGGGFSDTFDIPSYQKDAVAAYKSSSDADLPPANLWNNTGRGYPDIAALGGQKNPYCVAVNGMFSGVAGTSASCPVAAGVFALLNGLRASQGKAPLGFLNPFIYQNPHAFQDVTSGCNGGGRKYCFKAIKGWDAATGWGTPDYDALSKIVMEASSADKSIIV